MSAIVLHDYQQQLKNDIYRSWDSGARNVLAVLPTGGGKSIVMSDIILDGAREGLKQAVIAHRNELVVQMAGHVAKRGIPHKIIGSKSTISQAVAEQREMFGRSFVNPTATTAIIGVDTLVKRKDHYIKWCQQIDRYMGDEWHHCLEENKWGTAVDLMVNAKGLGVTATPCRADGKGLGRHADGLMDAMVLGPDMRYLINNGFLSDYEVVCPESDMRVDDEQVSANGDWSSQKLKKAAEKSKIVGDVVENYAKYAFGRKAICFATDVETAGRIADNFTANGIPAAAVSGKTPTAVRKKYISEFKSGKIWVLVNVDLFDEGFDVPDCEVCIMARPTASLGKYRQMVGRALRYVPGKVALIIDHVSNIVRHKLPDNPTVWTLDRRDKRGGKAKDPDDIPLTVCTNPNCVKPYERFRIECPYCGMRKPLPEPKSRSIEMIEGDLILLDREALDRMRAETQLEAPADIAERVAYAAGPVAGKAAANRQIEKIEEHGRLNAALEQWAGIERHKGYSDREIARKFYLTLGIDVLSALNGSQTRADMEKLRTTIEGWYM